MITFFTNQTADGTSAAFEARSGRHALVGWDGLGGGSATVEWSPDGGANWFLVDTLADIDLINAAIEIPSGHVRAVLTGATAADLTLQLRPVFLAYRYS